MVDGVVIENVAVDLHTLEQNGASIRNADSPQPKMAREYQYYEKDWRGLFRAALAELVGTFFLILVCVGSANSRILGNLTHSTTLIKFGPTYYLSIAFAFGLGIGGIVHIISKTSGGNVNPAVSFALFLDRRISLLRMSVYIVAQFIGGFIGAGVLYQLGSHSAASMIAGGNSYDTSFTNAGQAFTFEAFGTMFLVLTILATINEDRAYTPSYLQPLSIGVAIFVIHVWLIPYTNCGINPMRGTVWNIVIGQAGYHSFVFLFAPFVGAAVAVLLFNLLLT